MPIATLSLLAQTNVPPTATSPIPSTKSEFWTYAIAVIVPLLVGGFRKLVPSIPPWLLPVSTPFVGLALGAGLNALGASDMGWVDMAQAGAMAVMVRESFNQLIGKRMGSMSGSAQPRP